ncbi:MAG: Na+/H+ antiporter NhaC family protein [Bacteroidaceae bacterium]|nr:Na+/H+ antiporter NhaC family protein [Bacteroidaceae bacterium]
MKHGLKALSPIFFFLLVYLSAGFVGGDFYKMPISVAFMFTAVYAIMVMGGIPLEERISTFSRGAGKPELMLMIWIFILAGAFAASAKAMGAIDATVQLTLKVLPPNMLMAGLFVASCFISLSIGTSVGTIVALTPIAAGIADSTGSSVPLIVGVVVGGAYFGDNLSFISDTTIVATRTQGCKMSDKFRVNSQIVVPAAALVLLGYVIMGTKVHSPQDFSSLDMVKVLPYVVVLITALCGVDVMVVLLVGILLSGIIGIAGGYYGLMDWMSHMGSGIMGMSELIIVTLLAGGLMELMRAGGGIDYLIDRLTKRIHRRRGAEITIGALVAFTNVCTANNTIAILTVGPIAKDISERFDVDPRKSASLLDTFSCLAQAVIPYGAQILMAAGLAHLSPLDIIPCLYYPFVMGVFAILSIIFRWPKLKPTDSMPR